MLLFSNMKIKKILVGITDNNQSQDLLLSMANRHGLIAGATGTGKTVTLQRLAQQFSLAGISVFTADVKGDLAGLAYPGVKNEKIKEQLTKFKIPFTPQSCPVIFWDLFGKTGIPLRVTISQIEPVLLGRILNINETQQGIINVVYKLAADQNLLLLDLKDFCAVLDWMLEHESELKTQYGNITRSSVGAIQRNLLLLEEAGGDRFFGEPSLKLAHLMQRDASGKGMISIVDATQLVQDSRLYSTFLLWILSELFKQLPEVGDLDCPKLVFFFDEAHLLFNSAPKPLLDKIEQIVRLIRSKGVGIYFITQNPSDIPDIVLGQLGNRVQHALRAFTPKDQKAVRAAAETFRKNPKLNTEKIITELGVGEALVSFLNETGSPNPVEKTRILPPESRMGTLSQQETLTIINNSSFKAIYQVEPNRKSAVEKIKQKLNASHKIEIPHQTKTKEKAARGRPRQSIIEVFLKSTARSLGNKAGRQIIRTILESIFGRKK